MAVLALGLAAPWAAHASGKQETIFQDDDGLLHHGRAAADKALDELTSLGVDRIRVSVIWRNLVPAKESRHRPSSIGDGTDPAKYPAAELDPLDHLLRAARQRQIEVLLNVRGPAPDWALAPARGKLAGRTAHKPSPAEFRELVVMLGRRYSGEYKDENQGKAELPRVSAWSVWNEPNWGGHLQPQSDRHPRTRRLRLVAPRHYRRLYRAALQALNATGHRGDTILIGETAPVGNSKHGELSHLKPLEFLRSLFCLDSKLRPLTGRAYVRAGCDFHSRGMMHATGYAHHPYSVTQAPDKPSADKDFATLADAPRLKAVLDAAAANHRIPPDLPLWYTEFGYQTAPPDPFRGVSLAAQARWLVDAEYMTWSDPRVAAMTQFLLRDDEPRTMFGPNDPRRWGTYQTGLEFEDGRQKPAYSAWRLPLRVMEATQTQPLTLWGMVRPAPNGAPQRIRIQYRGDERSQWRTIAERDVEDPRGYFTHAVPGGRTGGYRFEWVRTANLRGFFEPEGGTLPSDALFVAAE